MDSCFPVLCFQVIDCKALCSYRGDLAFAIQLHQLSITSYGCSYPNKLNNLVLEYSQNVCLITMDLLALGLALATLHFS